MKLFIKNIFIFILLFLFVGCGKETKQQMGILNTPPDEFQVYKQKSLSVPPNFELRAPDSDELNNNVIEDKDLIFDDEDKVQLSANDEILLMTLGKDKIDSNIRKVINEENSLEDVDKSILDKILDFEPILEVKTEDEVLDPVTEKKRLEEIKTEIEILEAGVEEVEGSNDTEGDLKIAKEANENYSKEEKSILDKILDFEIFGSEDED